MKAYSITLKRQGAVVHTLQLQAADALAAIDKALQEVKARPVTVILSGQIHTYYGYDAEARLLA